MSEHMSVEAWREMNDLKIPNEYLFPDNSTAQKMKTGEELAIPRVHIPRNHEEDDITKQVVEYLDILKVQGKIVLFSHIPQETYTKSWGVKKKNTAMGVRAGVPDLLIVFPHKILFLELKRAKGGTISSAQIEWIQALQRVDGKVAPYNVVHARVAHGFEQAKEYIDALTRI